MKVEARISDEHPVTCSQRNQGEDYELWNRVEVSFVGPSVSGFLDVAEDRARRIRTGAEPLVGELIFRVEGFDKLARDEGNGATGIARATAVGFRLWGATRVPGGGDHLFTFLPGEAPSAGEESKTGSGELGDQPRPSAGHGEKRLAPDAANPEFDGVDRAALAQFVKSRFRAISSCYEKELKRHPSLGGRVVVRFTIKPDGRSSDVFLKENSVGSDAVAHCIRALIRGWTFPLKPPRDVTVSYPFFFGVPH